MKIWKRITQLSLQQLIKFGVVLIQKPFLIWPTFSATKETMNICDRHFGKEHFKSNRANAIRHALWNFILCQKSHKTLKNDKKAAKWAKKITNTYENVIKNTILDQAMDLHNNEVGISLFFNQNDSKMEEILLLLIKKSENSVKIHKIEDLKLAKNEMVHIFE